MIKKLSVAAAVLGVFVLVAVTLFLRTAGPSDAAMLVPEDTVLLASFPDLPRSFLRWQGSCLAMIGKEPEVKAFLEKPLARLMAAPGADETGRILAGLKPGRIFVAVTRVTTERADALVGFQFWGGKKDFDEAVARMRRELPPGETTREPHDGGEIVRSEHGKFAVFTGTRGRWGFVSTDGDLIKSALDRVRGKRSSPALAANPRFREVSKRMLKAPDFAFFLQPQKALDVLLETGRALGAESIPEQVEDLRSTEAVGGTLKFDGELQRDALFLLREGQKSADTLTHKTARFTAPETVVFVDFLARFTGLPTLLQKAMEGAAPQASIVEFAELASAACGPECAVVVNWGAGQMAPSGVLAVEIRDQAKAADALKKLMAFFPETRIVEEEGIKLYSIPSVSTPLASPTLTLTDQFLVLGIDPSSVSKAARSQGAAIDGLPAFAPAIPAFRSANEVFAFIDTRSVFERAYTVLRPVILFGAQVMPGAADMIDTGKLPQMGTISRHLPPVILSQQRLEDGVFLESSGPVTMSQLAIAAAAGGVLGAPPFH
ncbi:MAG: hypothetical protein WC003_10425 [Terrimicrobiaceae bacterium]